MKQSSAPESGGTGRKRCKRNSIRKCSSSGMSRLGRRTSNGRSITISRSRHDRGRAGRRRIGLPVDRLQPSRSRFAPGRSEGAAACGLSPEAAHLDRAISPETRANSASPRPSRPTVSPALPSWSKSRPRAASSSSSTTRSQPRLPASSKPAHRRCASATWRSSPPTATS